MCRTSTQPLLRRQHRALASSCVIVAHDWVPAACLGDWGVGRARATVFPLTCIVCRPPFTGSTVNMSTGCSLTPLKSSLMYLQRGGGAPLQRCVRRANALAAAHGARTQYTKHRPFLKPRHSPAAHQGFLELVLRVPHGAKGGQVPRKVLAVHHLRPRPPHVPTKGVPHPNAVCETARISPMKTIRTLLARSTWTTNNTLASGLGKQCTPGDCRDCRV